MRSLTRLIPAGTLAGLFTGILAAAPTIGTVGVTPTTIVAGTATQVLVTAPINDPALIPSSVNLQQRTSSGVLTAILGTLHDDGLDGDLAAGDKIFSLRLNLNIASPGTIVFRVSAAFRGSPVRSPSAGVNGTVTGPNNGGGGTVLSGPVTITITSPANLSYLNISPTTVTGQVAGNPGSVTINDLTTPVNNGQFSVALPLREGPNYITASASDGLTVNSSTVQATLDTTPPHVAVTQPPNNFTTTDATVTVTGIVNDIVVGTVNDQQAGVTVNGLTANVSNRTFTAAGVPLNLGSNTIQVIARDRVGNSVSIPLTVIRQAPAPSQIRLISGNNQTGAISTQMPLPLVAQLIGSNGNPAANVPVVFRVAQNNGLVSNGAAGLSSIAVNTDAQGKAQVLWTLGGRAGSGGNAVEATSAGYEGTAIFTATGTQGGPRNIVIDTGDSQVGAVSMPLPRPLIAVVVDGGNNRLANIPVTFSVTAGDGKFGTQSSFTVNSDSDGRVAATLALGPNEGNLNNIVQATFPGNPVGPAVFTASGKIPGDPATTTITGLVLDNSNVPIAGVTVRAVLSNLLTSNGQIVTTIPSVTTNAQGQFTVPNAPVGYVKVLVDGSTASRPNTIFPTLDYDLVTVAGQNNTVGLPIYLPALSNNRLCVTQTTGGGTLTMVEAPGFSLTFSPGQVTFPGGSKSGCVSATLVNSDKMPMVPGFGQQPRFLVTIQPAGALFNPPAAISMPNVDGLPPHAVTEMYSFDHDIGSFVAIGTGVVSADGVSISSSPGVGVLKAGWHCGGDPSANGTAATCPTCQTCQGSACVTDPANPPCDDGKYCTTNDHCVGGACKGDDRPDGTKTTTSYQLNQLQQIIRGITAFLQATSLDSVVQLPTMTLQFSKSSYDKCCEATQNSQPATEVAGTLGVQKQFGPFRPQIPPYTGNYTFNFNFFGARSIGVAYGLEISFTGAIQGQLKHTTTPCTSTPACWEGSVTGNAGVTGGIFGEVPNPAVANCGPNGDQACSLAKVTGTLTTGVQIQTRLNCTQLVLGEIQWTGLTAEATFEIGEGTFVDFSYQQQITLINPVTLATGIVIDLPASN